MLPGFFKHMPKKEEGNEIAVWKIEVVAIFFTKENVVYREVYKGKKKNAYLKVRWKAWLKDMATSGNYNGVGWVIEKVS